MNEKIIAVLIILLYFSPVFYQLSIVIKESKRGNKLPLKKFLRVFKYSVLIFILIITDLGIISHTNYLDYERPTTYDRFDEITFENFRGLEFFKKSLYGNERFAYVYTTIDSDFDENYVTIQSLFHPSRSFVYNKHTNSRELLKHEKYHIKITELYARKARKEVLQLSSITSDKVNEILEAIWRKEREYQKRYDYDTFHSYVLSEQKKYEKEVDSLLNLHAAYKNPKINIDEKD